MAELWTRLTNNSFLISSGSLSFGLHEINPATQNIESELANKGNNNFLILFLVTIFSYPDILNW
ncbi:Hypothetical protein MCYN_0286 [Mycoplasmopsis cynos C142]|uniref:Uncharacterized protein n=1 Tax=Mycoplasmopsis cynos (strain C142) TaxID=1246955 RepID=L0RUF9_MYCC1|nr:Hypothetical protein MCYN_0286 [Mycoplasmopsis cynos C142]